MKKIIAYGVKRKDREFPYTIEFEQDRIAARELCELEVQRNKLMDYGESTVVKLTIEMEELE